MQLIRCTGKLQKEMGLKKADLTEADPAFAFLGQWHANLFHIDRRKCVLFVNDKTLFNFIAPDVSRAQIKDLANLFRGYLQTVVADEGFSTEVQDKIQEEYRQIDFGKSSNKSVLSSVNDLAYHYKFRILEAGGTHSHRIPSIIKKLNRMPMGALKYVFPIEALKVLYAPAT